jgi:hypothetical protein
MCNEMVMQNIPTKYSYKTVLMKCGSTSIYGDMVLCEECAKIIPNPPAWTYEDAGEDDFDPNWRYEP